MKYLNKLYLLLFLALITSCAENVSVSYDGPTVTEFPSISSEVLEGAGETGVLVQLVGPQESDSTTVTFEVDEENSTAESGIHYTLITDGSIQIEADSSSAEILVDVTGAADLNAGESVDLILNLTGGDFSPSENYKTHTLTIVGQ